MYRLAMGGKKLDCNSGRLVMMKGVKQASKPDGPP
jgi:hypothetical protein